MKKWAICQPFSEVTFSFLALDWPIPHLGTRIRSLQLSRRSEPPRNSSTCALPLTRMKVYCYREEVYYSLSPDYCLQTDDSKREVWHPVPHSTLLPSSQPRPSNFVFKYLMFMALLLLHLSAYCTSRVVLCYLCCYRSLQISGVKSWQLSRANHYHRFTVTSTSYIKKFITIPTTIEKPTTIYKK